MSDDAEILVELLREILGDEKQHYENRGQIAFDCPECDEGRHKGNLEVNYHNHVFKCWSCDFKGGGSKFLQSIGIVTRVPIETKQRFKIQKLKF